MKVSKSVKSNFFFFLASIIWGFAFVAQCDAGDSINIFLLIAFRYILGSASLIPIILLYENRKEKKESKKANNKETIIGGAICGTILFIASALQQWGINVNPNAGKAGFITGTYTVLVPIICLILFRKKTGINVLLGAICAVIGLYLLSVQNGIGNIGFADIVLFIGAIFWAFHIITIDRFIDKVSPIKFSSVQFLVCGLWGLICMIITGNLDISVIISKIEISCLETVNGKKQHNAVALYGNLLVGHCIHLSGFRAKRCRSNILSHYTFNRIGFCCSRWCAVWH